MLSVLIVLILGMVAHAAEVIPPKPAHYFNDYANVVSPAVAEQLNQKLANFEKDTTNQVVVAVYPTMQSDSSIEDYTVRVAQKWAVGQKDRRNGVVLFVFVNDHKMYINVGYGLEGALPDITAKTILDNEIRPRFRANDYAGGLTAGVDAILKATRGEYQAKPHDSFDPKAIWIFLFWAIIIAVIIYASRQKRGVGYSRYGRRSSWFPTGGGSWGGGGGGGSWGGGGGGGFSGGGGSFGGGGAGGSW